MMKINIIDLINNNCKTITKSCNFFIVLHTTTKNSSTIIILVVH